MKAKIIEDYTLQDILGKGQFGSVYRAYNAKQNKFYAIKVMNLQKFKTTDKLKQTIKKQKEILSKLDHPNIVKLYQTIRTTNNFYMVYELCNGGTLADKIKKQVFLPEKVALHYFKQMLAGYAALQAEQILHRDIKPANIFLHDDILKIGDFGFCTELEERKMTDSMLGSPAYMAPEILGGYGYDGHADVWALGVTFYEMLYGVCPFQSRSIHELYTHIKGKKLSFYDKIEVSNKTKTLLTKMLSVSYSERISPSQLIRYQFEPKTILMRSRSATKLQTDKITYQRTIKFCRKNITYIAQTLEMLSYKINDEKYIAIIYILGKILLNIYNFLKLNSSYWKSLKIQNVNSLLDEVTKAQQQKIQEFLHLIKEDLLDDQLSPSIKSQLTNAQINLKYYMECIALINHDEHICNRLINCCLVYRHYLLVMEKNLQDFRDFTERIMSVEEKKQLAKKYALTKLP